MKIKDIERKPQHITTIGGQAVIEGVMMRGPKKLAVAIRRPDQEIELRVEELNSLSSRHKILGLPFIRGVVGLVESLFIGTRILMYSADFMEDEEDYEEGFIEKKLGERSEEAVLAFTVLVSFLMAIGLFMVIPTLITSLFKARIKSPLGLNLVEGLVRISVFLIYITAISKMEDMRRIFEYHGAEHKSIHCYEKGLDLTVENAQAQPGLHPRCGTSFLFMVMIVSIFVLSFFGWPSPLRRLVNRIIMFPVIAGLSYEINRLIGRSNSRLAYYLSYPGLMIQKIATIKEPDQEQLEVALESLRAVIPENKEDDKW